MKIGTIINNQFAGENNPTKYFIYTGVVGRFATGICFVDGKIEKMKFDKKRLNNYLEPIGYCKAFDIIKEDLKVYKNKEEL